MTQRFPLRITWFLCVELTRLLLITASCLVLVISFAAAVKPLADGQIELPDALRFMLLATVPMLQFALPFAAGFAATLTYHRFAAENEAAAAMAGGISHRTLLAPAAIVGVGLALLIATLTNFTIPDFLRSMERIIARNATDLLVATIDRGQSIGIGEWDLYASGAYSFAPGEGSETDAYEVVVLENVFAAQRTSAGDIAVFVSADLVRAMLYADPDATDESTVVQLVFDNALIVQEDTESSRREMISSPRTYTQPIQFPGTFSDDPKYRTMGQLAALKRHPERVRGIAQTRRRVATRLSEHFTLAEVDQRLRRMGTATLNDPSGARILIRGEGLLADGADRWRIITNEQERVLLRWERQDSSESAHLAETAHLELQISRTKGEAKRWWSGEDTGTLRLVARRVATLDDDGIEPEADRASLTFGSLSTNVDYFHTEKKKGAFELIEHARAIAEAGSPIGERVGRAARGLSLQVDDLLREVRSKQHERAAFSFACFLMVATGAIIGFRMKDALPLPVYLWSFFPALFAVITMNSGQRLMHKAGTPGILLMWGGVAALAAFAVYEFTRLRRH